MSFTDDDLKWLKEYRDKLLAIKLNTSATITTEKLVGLLARLEATNQCAYDLEGICEVECPDCGKELEDKHESTCKTGKHLEAWRNASGKEKQ